MLKLRLKRGGRKGQPSYRVVVMEARSRRNGRPVENLGYYNPLSKEFLVKSQQVTLKQGERVLVLAVSPAFSSVTQLQLTFHLVVSTYIETRT